jgi:hypothetical protein
MGACIRLTATRKRPANFGIAQGLMNRPLVR